MSLPSSTVNAPMSAQDHAAGYTDKKRTIAALVVALAFVLDLLDSTIVNVAIPSIQSSLHASYAAIQWLIAGYALAFALLLITGGRMGDVFGYKKLFMIGVAGFSLSSLLCGLAWNPEVLVAARLIQGSMAALMAPQVMSVIQIMYKPQERMAVNGIFGALGGLSASLGPVIGGLLIKSNVAGLGWRPIFLINVPVGLFALFMGAKYLPNGKSAHPLKLDFTGTFIIMAALGLLIFPLIQGRELDWPAWTFVMMAASLPFFGVFAWWQHRRARLDGSPLVMPGLFKHRSFTLGLATNVFMAAAMGCFSLTFMLLLQLGLGFSAIHAALTGLFMAVGVSFTMAFLGRTVIPKLGRLAVTIGASLMAIGSLSSAAIVTHYNEHLTSWHMAPALLVLGVGMGMIFASMMAIMLSKVDPRDAGSASGTASAMQQLGGALGVALIGVIFFGQITSAAPASFDQAAPQLRRALTVESLPAAVQDQIVAGVRTCFVDRAKQKDGNQVPASCRQAQNAPASPAVESAVKSAVKQATALTFASAFVWGTFLQLALLIGCISLSFFLPKHIRHEAFEQAPAPVA